MSAIFWSLIFGTEYQAVANEALDTLAAGSALTTSLKLTTTSLPAGTYRFSWYAALRVSVTTNDMRVRVGVDDSADGAADGTTATDIQYDFTITVAAMDTLSQGGSMDIALAAGVHNIRLQFAPIGAAGTGSLSRRRLSLFRVA